MSRKFTRTNQEVKYYDNGSIKSIGQYTVDGTPHGLFKYYIEVDLSSNNYEKAMVSKFGFVQEPGSIFYTKEKKKKFFDIFSKKTTTYVPIGMLEQTENYDASGITQMKIFHPNGNLKMLMDYENGKKVKGVIYYENGNLLNECSYLNDKRHGLTTFYDENGKKSLLNFNEGELIESEANSQNDTTKETSKKDSNSPNILTIVIWDKRFKIAKDDFFNLLEYFDEDEIQEDYWTFSTAAGDFNVNVTDTNTYEITPSGVIATGELLYDLNKEEKYVVLANWTIANNLVIEVDFVNCECPSNLKEYYKITEYDGGFFIKENFQNLLKVDSQNFKNIIKEIESREIDGDVEVYNLSEWEDEIKSNLEADKTNEKLNPDSWEVTVMRVTIYKDGKLIDELDYYDVYVNEWIEDIEDYDRQGCADICGTLFEGKIWQEYDFDNKGFELSWGSEEILEEFDNFDKATNFCLALLDYPNNQPRRTEKDK